MSPGYGAGTVLPGVEARSFSGFRPRSIPRQSLLEPLRLFLVEARDPGRAGGAFPVDPFHLRVRRAQGVLGLVLLLGGVVPITPGGASGRFAPCLRGKFPVS